MKVGHHQKIIVILGHFLLLLRFNIESVPVCRRHYKKIDIIDQRRGPLLAIIDYPNNATFYRVNMCRREYWMIRKGQTLLAVVWFDSYPTPFPPLLSASCLSFSDFLCIAGQAYWRKGGGGGAKSSEREKAWSFINHSIISDVPCC